MDEERMRSGHWLRLLLCVPVSALTLTVWWREGHPAHKNPVPLIPRGCLPEQLEEDLREPTEIHLEKQLLNGSSSKIIIQYDNVRSYLCFFKIYKSL